MAKYARDDFTAALLSLLPRGRVWPKELTSVQAQASGCYAPTFERISDTAVALLVDAFPGTTTDLLTEWEATLGLPDACTAPGSQTFVERQEAVADKISASGGPQRPYFIQIAARLRLSMTINEYETLTVSNGLVGSFLYGDGWPWSWLADLPVAAYGTVAANTLNCRLQTESPEYTDVVLGFGQEVVTDIFNKVDQLFNAVHYVIPAAISGEG
ncbi:MAG: DUF2313 domain-containing protein [Candidatus Pseudomonas phytovorans]|uniref:DUF2313 domain-containing protein n=1 Tax=Candidatus Pseudomonas phytovorans TaxID=3121377 RepID=A0AAJ6BE75_9PSED|nr:putative phage tail protein [Pseudomonas sp.]WEK32932.1 MAG: DUF2313 domain-containing protein [Pseudomonas sp.]